MFVSAEQYNWNTANAFVLGFGEEVNTRTFTWQSQIMKDGYVKYKKVGDVDFKTVKAETTFLQHPDCAVSKHSCIIKKLDDGEYIYKVGNEGYWSEEEKFEVKTYNTANGDEINILWCSDEQSWIKEEMNAFANVFDNSHIETEQYYMNILSEDLKPIVSDLRNIHMKDSNTASDIDYQSMVKNIID